MTLELLLPYVLGAVAYFVAGRLGLPVPVPVPAPPLTPAKPKSPLPFPDKEAADFLTWVLAVKTGKVQLDDLDKELVKQIKAAIADLN